jgi:3-hydroxyisobutyrate dehydrogenase-like beta-hydroxyacid dehydrogenase
MMAVGFLGVGQMGAPMAERLLGEGIALHVHDPRPEAMAPFVARGATAHDTPRGVADQAAIVLACLPSGAVSEAAALGPDGVLHGSAIRIHAEMSTIGAACVQRVAAGLAPRGITLVDAPITGGPPGARAGTLAMMAAGDPSAVEQLRPLLLRIGRSLHVVGAAAGQAQVMKLVNNVLVATHIVTTLEAFAMGAKAGLDPAMMADLVNAGTGRSYVSTDVMGEVLSGRFAFGASVSVLDKDIALGVQTASDLGVPMWTIEQAARVWRFAASHGQAGEDMTALAKLIEGWAGAEIRSRP